MNRSATLMVNRHQCDVCEKPFSKELDFIHLATVQTMSLNSSEQA